MTLTAFDKRLFVAIEKSLELVFQGLFAKSHDKIVAGKSDKKGIDRNNESVSLCVALSGGLDSCVLLHGLARWRNYRLKEYSDTRFSLSAFHVNHGISKHANDWLHFCKDLCKSSNVEFASSTLSLTKQKQRSLEADARDARYTQLDNYILSQNSQMIMLLAHHQDDQLETFFLQLKRGAGLDGLSAMKAVHTRHSGATYVRPLLSFSRNELETYASDHQLSWVEDDSNSDLQYDRNFLRKEILPQLTKRWPSIAKTVSRSAQLCEQAAVVNMEYMLSLQKTMIDEQNRLNIEEIKKCSDATQQSFLHFWVNKILVTSITFAQSLDLIKLMYSDTNSSAYVQFGDLTIERFQGKLLPLFGVFSDANTDESQTSRGENSDEFPIDVKPQEEIRLSLKYFLMPSGAVCPAECKIVNKLILPSQGLTCVFGASHLKFKLTSNRPSKKLKAWFQEWGVSPLERKNWPIFMCNGQVVAAGRHQAASVILNELFDDNIQPIEMYLIACK